MAKGKPMTDEELLTLVGQYERASLGSSTAAGATISSTVYPNGQTMNTLEIDRYNALNAYYARPLGNEVEDRSQVVIPELRDTIEWIKPQLMRMFAASKQICRFEPHGPEDVEQAQLETDAVNHVFMKENNGFFVLHDFFTDALLLRNGYVQVYTEDETETSIERYSGITEAELPGLLTPESKKEEIEIVGQSEQTISVVPPMLNGMPPQPAQQLQVFDLKIRRKKKSKKTRVICAPPEEMRVSADARGSLDDVAFSGRLTVKTRSALISEGFDATEVNALPTGKMNFLDMNSLARNEVTDQLAVDNPSDFAMQEVEWRDLAVKVDYDGDGVAELRHILIGGDKILENEEIEETPFASGSCMRMPHRHTGISYYDLIMDLQIIKTTLFRQGLDNLYLANNVRTGVNFRTVNIDDLLTSRIGGVVRFDGNPAESYMPLEQTSNLTAQILPAMEYVDSLREMRTGVGRDTMGLDFDALQDVTKGGQLAGMAAAGLKIELVARLLGEGVKDIFKKIHGEMIRNQDQPLMFQQSGKWVTVDPRSWRKRNQLTVSVGLGSGNREEARGNLALLQGAQEKIGQLGLVGPKQAYAAFKMLCDILGYENASEYAMDPSSPEYAQHQQQMQQQAASQPNPALQVAKLKADTDVKVATIDAQADKLQADATVNAAHFKAQTEAAQQEHQMGHEAIQGHRDREVQLDANHMQILLAEIRALGGIIAAQMKQNAAVNAGKTLADDVSAAGSIQ